MSDLRFDVLVLAGRRDANDELAEAAGATHRVLLDIAGEPMLVRVLTTLIAHDRTDAILLCSDAPDILQDVPRIAEMLERSQVRFFPAQASPSRSVLAGIDALASSRSAGETDNPLLVTTADHALLDHAMLDYFFDAACRSGADAAQRRQPVCLHEPQRAQRRALLALGRAASQAALEDGQQVRAHLATAVSFATPRSRERFSTGL
ncbi:MAG: nucleotidyltransferase family protein [Deltaproteobacteria bacterium]|nr:nucleotidyltransferase family protein [Deltaproteobacteria bacterium]